MNRAANALPARLLWDCKNLLGEGPIWIEPVLWFVDIKQGNLHRLVPETDERTTFHIGGSPSFIVPLEHGLLAGNGRELVRIEDGVAAAAIATIDMPANNRTNDATVDRNGTLWFGTMDDRETEPSGRIYRFDGRLSEMGGACTITNGPAVSPDGRWLYHVDTLAGTIWRFDIGDRKIDTLGKGSVFVQIDPEDGHPDGVTIDSEGCVWVGLWGGWSLRRYGPDGYLLATVRLPCANVTKVAFGGADLRTGYVTTARAGLSDQDLAAQPGAGGLFAFDAPVPGIATPRLRLA